MNLTFTGRFATVRGQLGRYRVHLGTGHTYVEPHGPLLDVPPKKLDDEYLPHDAGGDLLQALVAKILALVEDGNIDDPKFKRRVRAGAEAV